MPAESLMWLRIAERNIQDCNNFKTVFANEASAHIIQGALGNSYFVNALRSKILCHNEINLISFSFSL
jgi:hypothetical protein